MTELADRISHLAASAFCCSSQCDCSNPKGGRSFWFTATWRSKRGMIAKAVSMIEIHVRRIATYFSGGDRLRGKPAVEGNKFNLRNLVCPSRNLNYSAGTLQEKRIYVATPNRAELHRVAWETFQSQHHSSYVASGQFRAACTLFVPCRVCFLLMKFARSLANPLPIYGCLFTYLET